MLMHFKLGLALRVLYIASIFKASQIRLGFLLNLATVHFILDYIHFINTLFKKTPLPDICLLNLSVEGLGPMRYKSTQQKTFQCFIGTQKRNAKPCFWEPCYF